MQRRFSRLFATLFVLVALHRTITLPLVMIAPQAMMIEAECADTGCAVSPTPTRLLPVASRIAVERDQAAVARFEARLREPAVRATLLAMETVRRGPMIAMFLFVGIAMWLFGARNEGGSVRAVVWLKRASWAALVLAIVSPFADSLRSAFLLEGVLPADTIELYVDGGRLVWNLMFAAAAWAAIWAIGAGSCARAELSQIV